MIRSAQSINLATVLIALLVLVSVCATRASADPAKVYVIDVHGTVWPGQATFVINNLDQAAAQGASAVILDVDTFGGLAASAVDIKDALVRHDKDYTEVAYVDNRALSSGSLISLSCKYIAMSPAATLGSAQPHPGGGGDPDPETLSWARKEFATTADYRGRNPAIATAWVTAPGPIPTLGIKEGDILTLTTKQAQSVGYCDDVATGIPDILTFLKLPGATVVPEHMDFWQSAAAWVCDPWVTAVILGLGLALIIVEMLTLHSWGIAGGIGGVAVFIVFLAHIITGTATWVGLVVFLVGVGLLLFETHVLPGHGLSAIAGLICIFLGIYWAIGGSSNGSVMPMITALLITLASIIAFFMYLPKSRVWRLIGQAGTQKASAGYVAAPNFTDLIGHEGRSITPLRPSGAVEIDGIRYNVVTEGAFLPPDAPVQVVRVQGSRIVVREIAA
jgi:membrane-bound serine protease (ClpP class)